MNTATLGCWLAVVAVGSLSAIAIVEGTIEGDVEGGNVATEMVGAPVVNESSDGKVTLPGGGVEVRRGRGAGDGILEGDTIRGANVGDGMGAVPSDILFPDEFNEFEELDEHNPIPQKVPTITAATRKVFNIIAPKMIFIQNSGSSLDDIADFPATFSGGVGRLSDAVGTSSDSEVVVF